MSSAKIRIKVGSMELEYEGDPSFLTGGIETLLNTMGALSASAPELPTSLPPHATESGSAVSISAVGKAFTTNTIAAHIGAKTGPELLVCALATLEIVQGKECSTRAEILNEMKKATQYFNKNMTGNLTGSLTSLVSAKRINEVATESYALTAAERIKIEAKVAEIG